MDANLPFDWIAANWLGVTGLVSGLLCVILLIRENVLTFPIGAFYAVITVYVMFDSRLYADVLINVYYVGMNLYGWYFWMRGAGRRSATQALLVTWLPRRQWGAVIALSLVGTLGMGYYLDNFTDAALAYPDSFTTTLSFIAMWMSARKYLDNWLLWFVVNVVSVGLYLVKAEESPDLYFYAVLYGVYILLAVVGYRTWAASMRASTPT